MNPTKNSLSFGIRNDSAEILEQLVYATLDIAGQVKVAHWNVRGPLFPVLHKQFDRLNADLQEYADQMAERAVQLGAVIFATPRAVAASSDIPELPKAAFEAPGVVSAVLNRVSRLAEDVRKQVEPVEDSADCVTANLLIDVAAGLDKWVWMLEKQVAQ